jgi:hypothetical protein
VFSIEVLGILNASMANALIIRAMKATNKSILKNL